MSWSDVGKLHTAGGLQAITVSLCDFARDSRWEQSTKDTYKTAYNSWVTYCGIMGVDTMCRDNDGKEWSLSDTTFHVNQYIAIQCGLRFMSPTSIKDVYFPGINQHFTQEKKSNQFRAAYTSKHIQAVLTGFQKVYEKTHPAADRMKIAFGLDLALKAIEVMEEGGDFNGVSASSEDAELRRERLFCAFAVGITYMLRGGEHVEKKGGRPAGLLRSHVIFLDRDSIQIPYDQVGRSDRPAHRMCVPSTPLPVSPTTLVSGADHGIVDPSSERES